MVVGKKKGKKKSLVACFFLILPCCNDNSNQFVVEHFENIGIVFAFAFALENMMEEGKKWKC